MAQWHLLISVPRRLFGIVVGTTWVELGLAGLTSAWVAMDWHPATAAAKDEIKYQAADRLAFGQLDRLIQAIRLDRRSNLPANVRIDLRHGDATTGLALLDYRVAGACTFLTPTDDAGTLLIELAPGGQVQLRNPAQGGRSVHLDDLPAPLRSFMNRAVVVNANLSWHPHVLNQPPV